MLPWFTSITLYLCWNIKLSIKTLLITLSIYSSFVKKVLGNFLAYFTSKNKQCSYSNVEKTEYVHRNFTSAFLPWAHIFSCESRFFWSSVQIIGYFSRFQDSYSFLQWSQNIYESLSIQVWPKNQHNQRKPQYFVPKSDFQSEFSIQGLFKLTSSCFSKLKNKR